MNLKNIKEMRKVFKFKISKVKKVETLLLKKSSDGSTTMVTSEKDVTGKNFDEIYAQVLRAEKADIELEVASRVEGRYESAWYCIKDYETLTDNRSVFGHENQTTEKIIKIGGRVFVAGKLTDMKDFYTSDDYQKLGIVGLQNFFDFIKNIFNVDVTLEFLESGKGGIKFVYFLQGDYGEFSLYFKLEESDIYKPFDL